MPGFGFGKSIIAGYAAFSKQWGLYVSKAAITTYADDFATSASFPSLSQLANLSSLNIETCDPNEIYADEDVLALAKLKRLQYLNLNGAASPAALQELANHLPDCKISHIKK